jgi:hypothetical protein
MRHSLLAATMLVIALVVTFGIASVLESVEAARSNAAPHEASEAPRPAKPAVQPVVATERVTSLFR